MNLYESDDLVSQYLAFHYGDSYFGVENYPQRCAAFCVEAMNGRSGGRALDLGCGVGRSTFELARTFAEVVGVDLSSRFIDSARTLQERGRLAYFRRDEGELGEWAQADLNALELDAVRGKVEFRNEDACALADPEDYDLVFAGNLIDRLRDPARCLSGFHRYLKIGGMLVISSPYTLLTEYTPRDNWIGGFVEQGRPLTVLEGMEMSLRPRFQRLGQPVDVPFVIRETRRKFQHTIAELSVWQRVS